MAMQVNRSDHVLQMQEAMAQAGLPVDDLIADGQIHRFADPSDKRREKSGWYVLRLREPYSFGYFGSFKGGGFYHSWQSDQPSDLSERERFELAEMVRSFKQSVREEKQKAQAAAAVKANEVWQRAYDTLNHPYLDEKKVPAYGLRSIGPHLIIPVCTVYGELVSLQRISPTADGGFTKRFLKEGRKQGCGHLIGSFDETGTIAIAEGYATAASVYEMMDVAGVFVAFDCGNLSSVATAIRAAYPQIKIVLAADNDHATPGNPGLTKAKEAARRVNGYVTCPKFPDGCTGTDYNDLANLRKGL